jgi:hypothetical protein
MNLKHVAYLHLRRADVSSLFHRAIFPYHTVDADSAGATPCRAESTVYTGVRQDARRHRL